VYYRDGAPGLLHGKFIRSAKQHWASFCTADTTGVELSFGKALIGSLLFSRWLRKHRANQSMVGVVLPASVGGALVNVGILLAGKVPVNLNFTAGPEAMTAAIQQCGIDTILTSRAFLSPSVLAFPSCSLWSPGLAPSTTRTPWTPRPLAIPWKSIKPRF